VCVRNYKAGRKLGFFSTVPSLIPLSFILASTLFPQTNLTANLIIFGGGGGSLLTALAAGLIGSRWWLLALLAPGIVIALLLFNP
jgi:hypothetical protein